MASQNWESFIRSQESETYWRDLQDFVARQREKTVVYPPEDLTYEAFSRTPVDAVRVVILGQDPYHGHNQADGLAFSASKTTKRPPSLRNIFKELQDDVGVTKLDNSLAGWADQGVLLLNSCLTVESGRAGSHQAKGWETFTDRAMSYLSMLEQPIVFILWGGYARSKRSLIDGANNFVLESPHPSPLSAYRGFWGSKPFSKTNEALQNFGLATIDWAK